MATESAVRKLARRRGYSVSKCRDRMLHANNHGEYMLADDRNWIVMGENFDATLEEIKDHLSDVPVLT
jgi:hypothetical protein